MFVVRDDTKQNLYLLNDFLLKKKKETQFTIFFYFYFVKYFLSFKKVRSNYLIKFAIMNNNNNNVHVLLNLQRKKLHL